MIIIRAAEAADQRPITRLVRGARLNPLHLAWPHFIVAEEVTPAQRTLAGAGQLRPHADGSRELASLVVLPAYQQRGLGGALIQALLSRAPFPLYLYCRGELVPYYARFGFRLAMEDELPPSLARHYRISQAIIWGATRVLRRPLVLAAMVHPGPQ
ncbi:MAG: GNAT family N-acetyltransferase [Chloroflexi bacterium]|nr:MAG: GNAT family N-acetyltransferase [Chloroflexota bacterium]